MTKKCPECGSEKIIPNLFLCGESSVYQFYCEAKPEARFFKKRTWGKCTGELCGDCGLISLRAKDPAQVWEAYQQNCKNE